ncbi:MAG: DNA-binding protein [Glaciihabitans sp.]|nr:DNA-binding protein [Glaciihabitans sp.]
MKGPDSPVVWGTTRDAAARCGVSVGTIRRWIKDGTIDARRLGPRLMRVNLSALDTAGTPAAKEQLDERP